MTSFDNDLTDFRSRAVAESEAIRRSLRNGLSLEKSSISYCVERQPSLSQLRAPIKIIAVACLVLCISGVATGGIIAFLSKRQIIADSPGLLAIAACCSVGGVLAAFVPTFVERRIVHHHLCRRDEDFGSGGQVQGIHVSLEHAPTYGSIKVLAEDVGLIYIHPEAQYVKMDGLSYEYVIPTQTGPMARMQISGAQAVAHQEKQSAPCNDGNGE
jgi:hypothetical protein